MSELTSTEIPDFVVSVHILRIRKTSVFVQGGLSVKSNYF